MYQAPQHYSLIIAAVPSFSLLLSALFIISGVRMSLLYIYEQEFTFYLKHVFLHISRRLFSTENSVFINGSGKKNIQCAIGYNCWDTCVAIPQTSCYFDALKVVRV
jgi:hypothetical protein